MNYTDTLGSSAQRAKRSLATADTQKKNKALELIAQAIDSRRAEILAANAKDIEAARANNMRASLVDRLMLNDARIDDIVKSIYELIKLEDPIGKIDSGTIRPNGREEGVKAGANVIMPNLSPTAVRKKYMLYDNKICTGDESAQCRGCLEMRMKSIGYEVAVSRGDHI